MAKAMTKSQIMTKLAEETDLPKKKVIEVVEVLVGLAYKEAKADMLALFDETVEDGKDSIDLEQLGDMRGKLAEG